jgi:hypothetical protein
LRKMLSLHPGDRYVSARRLWLDLLPLLGDQAPVTQMLMDPETPAEIEFSSSPLHESSAANPASAKRNFFFKPAVTRVQQDPSSSPISLNWVSPRIAIVGSLLALLGMGTFIFRSPMLSSSAQMLEDKATRNPVPTVVTKPGEPSEIVFDVGEMSKMIPGSLQGNSFQVYTLKALRGQIMSVSLNGSSVLMNISRANREPLESSAWQTRSWTGTLPADDTYSVEVSGTGVYALDLSVTPLNREVSVGTQRLKLALGKASTTVTGTLKSKQVKRYIMKAQNNKMMILSGALEDVSVTVTTPRGERIGGTTVQSKSWQGRLPMDGDYVVEVATNKVKSDYQLSIEMY